ncbi:MAG: hypothetical protein AAGC63_11990 [Propionicimonas sp.]|nr:hypothetical protein [Propionicimonas sp.]
MTIWTYQGWLGLGHTRSELTRELKTGRLVRLRRGFLATPPDNEWDGAALQRAAATAPFLGAGTVFARETAASIHGLPLMPWRTGEVIVYRTGGGHGSVLPTVHARQASLAEADVQRHGGLPVTSLARTAADLARSLPFEEAVAVVDAALARGLAREELLRRASTGRGCRMARRAIEAADPLSESAGESVSRARIIQHGFPLPRLQVEITDASGTLIGRVDFLWEGIGLVGEFDGQVKYGRLVPRGSSTLDVVAAEVVRERALEDAGYRVIRWSWSDLWDGTLSALLTRELLGSTRQP